MSGNQASVGIAKFKVENRVNPEAERHWDKHK